MNKLIENVTVLILAGGKGSRMGTKTRKQYMEIKGKKVFEYSLDVFTQLIKDVVIITPENAATTRFGSIIKFSKKSRNDYIIIHDASRPFVNSDVILRLVRAVKKYPCAYPVIPINNSIAMDKGEFLERTPDRSNFRHVQTPQAFQKAWLMKALSNKKNHHIHIPEMIRMAGGKVKHIEGTPWLFKITRKPDIYAAEGYLEEIAGKVGIITDTKSILGNKIKERLEDSGIKIYSLSESNNVKLKETLTGNFDKVIQNIYNKEGRIDILVNTSEIVDYTPISKAGNKELKSILDVNLLGMFNLSKIVLKYMRKEGVIVNITDNYINKSIVNSGIYGISKAATEHLSKILASEFSKVGISVFTVCSHIANTHESEEIASKTAKIVTLCSTYNLSPLSGQTFEIQ
ncbi:MAG: SDR family oxidoreductase [Candidatus Dojkabacteria bacterium]|nr:SDR family oxidoreductase [Candidatus Dojkabacteria bacterium]